LAQRPRAPPPVPIKISPELAQVPDAAVDSRASRST